MKHYLRKSVKYFVAVCVLCLALMALMIATGTSSLDWKETGYVMLHTPRFAWMLAVVAVAAAFYPRFGFLSRRLSGSLDGEGRQAVKNAFRSAGYRVAEEQPGRMRFRADSLWRRWMMLGEDAITVTPEGEGLRLEGNRRGMARVIYCWDAYARYTNE